MRRLWIVLLVPLGLLAASCGGGSKSGGGSIDKADAAVVGTEHITRATLDRRVAQAKCSYKARKQPFPTAGSQEYQVIQQQILQSLVQHAELTQKAPGLGVSITDAQIDKQLKKIKKTFFRGNEKRYQAELKRQCVTDAEVRDQISANLLSDSIYNKITAGAKVSDLEVKAYYESHPSVYTRPATRVVRHILVKSKSLADRLYKQLKAGANFATLAKKYSQDPGSKSQGGQLTITRGQTVPEFDKVAFSLKTGALSKPVKTQYGWHVIRAETPATKSHTTPFAQVKQAIRQQLVQQKKSNTLQAWVAGVQKEFASKISYAAGLAPPTAAAPPTTTG